MGMASIDTTFTDGSLQSTGKNTDLALSGNGFFILGDGANKIYTRSGAFEFDADGKESNHPRLAAIRKKAAAFFSRRKTMDPTQGEP